MGFAEKAKHELICLMVEHRHGAFHTLENSSRGENAVVKYLAWLDTATNPKDISEKLNLSSARIATILGNLEKKGIIKRTLKEEDRRRINVSLTDYGREIAISDKNKLEEKLIKIFTGMGEEETNQFIYLIKRFLDLSHQVNSQKEGEQ